MIQHEDRFDQPDDACRFKQMTDVRFNRTNRTKLFFCRILFKRFTKPVKFNRIAELRSGAMRFDERQCFRGNARVFPGRLNDLSLSCRIRCCNPGGCSVLIQRASLDYAVNMVSVANSILQRFQQDCGRAFTCASTV
ncbi:Uncharacterised protein [Streptococcus pneumoniae]|nr:Uncharacterised protein [Streptococcus pneumoniae]